MPIVTLTTDFGTADHYVAAMKAALLAGCPSVTLVDVTHHVPRQDVTAGSFTLERAVAAFPPGTVHLAVVDPGVGTARRLLVADVAGSTVVCPDNGLVTWAWRRHGGGAARELTWRPAAAASHTFHGRDVMAPVAARLAAGERAGGPPIDPVLLDLHLSPSGQAGVVIHVDGYGNATTNVSADLLGKDRWVVNDRAVGPIRRTYADVPIGSPLALVGSSGLLEIAVRNGSAAEALRLHVGDPVWTG